MPIFGQNSILNVFVPKFLIKVPVQGQILSYDGDEKAFVNTNLPNYSAVIAGLQAQINTLQTRVTQLENQNNSPQ